MRFWPRLLAVLAVMLLLGGSLAACGGEGSGPEDAVRGALKAMEDLDGEKMASYFIEDVREELAEGMEFAFALIDEVKIYNIETRVVSESGDRATVEMAFDGDVTVFGQTETEHTEDTVDLVKMDGKWLIGEDAFLE
jgi:hypothetical protein